jgi:hypothetical protein
MNQAAGLRRRPRVEEDVSDESTPLLGQSASARTRETEIAFRQRAPPSADRVLDLARQVPQPNILDMIMRLLSNILNSMTSWFPSSSVNYTPDSETQTKMANFKAYLNQKFDGADEEHLKTLKGLWEIAFGEQTFPSKVASNDWKKLGFQSDDPQRDFRATGIFGLRNIVFFAEKYPQSFRRFADVSNKSPNELYPFAITCFNLTMMVMELLGWGWKSKTSSAKMSDTYSKSIRIIFAKNYSREANENAFSEIFCMALYLLDKEWTDSKATYMDFQRVLAKTQASLEQELGECNSLAEVLQKNSIKLS